MNFTHASLFSGIGGFDLAAEWMGWDNLFHCEWNTFCQKVLAYHFPKSIPHHDITKTDFSIYRGRVDILTGGFPCQPFSVAGQRRGTEDERHLWPEMLRAVREIQPQYIVGENVPGLINWSNGLVFEQVQTDLEAEGYEVTPFLLPASGINAPHQRERIWIIAYSTKFRQNRNDWEWEEGKQCRVRGEALNILDGNGWQGLTSDSRSEQLQKRPPLPNKTDKQKNNPGLDHRSKRSSYIRNATEHRWDNWPTQPPICNGNDGISSRLDGLTFREWREGSIMAGGNAIVPQVALQIFKAIEEFQKLSYI